MTRRNSRSAAGAAAVAVALVLTAFSTAASATSRCGAAGGSTVAANREARVYTVDGDDGHTLLYGCARPDGRARLLADAFDDDYVTSSSYGDLRLRGHMLAFTTQDMDVSCKAACPPDYQAVRSSIAVHDLLRRRTVRTIAGVAPLSLAVTTRGAAAWAQVAATSSQVEIRAADSWGRRTLDRGAIDARSLSSELTIVSWRRDGVERFSRLR